jgi:Tol biopolymer transport system component
VATSSNIQIVAPSETALWGLTFSSDSNYLYYIAQEKGDPNSLYKMPALGGNGRKVMTGVESRPTFSPDGSRFAFVRNSAPGESALVIGDAEVSSEQTLAVHKDAILVDAAWSPDGRKIACSGFQRDSSGSNYKVSEIAVEGGDERPITTQKWSSISQIAWLKDGKGLVMVAKDSGDAGSQVWQLSYPGGAARKITADLNDYTGVSLALDSMALVSTRNDAAISIWSVPDGNPDGAKQITSGTNKTEGWNGLAWTPSDRIIYASFENEKQDIWEMDRDGANQKQLTFGSGQTNYGVSVSPDGRYIVFSSNRSGNRKIWRVNIDGSNPKQLTSGASDVTEFNPFFSPDGQWVIYRTAVSDNEWLTWKVPTDGGEPAQLSTIKNVLGISADGRLLAYLLPPDKPGVKSVGISSYVDNRPIRVIDLPQSAMHRRMEWSPDGQAITFIDKRKVASNIWNQPLDGGNPKQLTNFKSDEIWAFAWSQDGKQLACVRRAMTTDVVLIRSAK